MDFRSKLIRLAYRFPSDDKPFISYTSEAGNMLAKHLQKPYKSWRSTSLNDQIFVIDLNGLQNIGVFCLYGHNLFFTAFFTIELYLNSELTNLVYSTTINAYTPLYGIGEGLLGITPLGGYSEQLGDKLPLSIVWIEKTVASFAKITISDPENPAGYMQASRLVLGDYWQPNFNFTPGYASVIASSSEQITTADGGTFANRKAQQRKSTVSFKNLLPNEETEMFKLVTYVDKNKHVLVSAYPLEGTSIEQLHNILGFLVDWEPMNHENVNQRTFGFSIQESI